MAEASVIASAPTHSLQYAPQPVGRSRIGIASFYLAVAGICAWMAIFNLAVVGRATSDMVGFKLLGTTLILPVLGTLCGVISMFQRRRYRGLPVVGLVINLLMVLFVLLLIVPSLGREWGYW